MNNNSSNLILYLITVEYPFGIRETYLENEINVLSGYFKKIYILPLVKESPSQREVPPNVTTIFPPLLEPIPNNKSVFFKNFRFIISTLLTQFYHSNNKGHYLQKIWRSTRILCTCIEKAKYLESLIIKEDMRSTMFYSYWLNYGALIFGVLKHKKVINNFVCRVHGFTFLQENKHNGFTSFNHFIQSHAKSIFVGSEASRDFFESRNIFSKEKMALSYLGTKDHGMAPFNEEASFSLVSCANLVDLKRIPFIIEVLKNIDFSIKWTHFGDGPLRDDILEYCKQLPDNIEVDLKGHILNIELMNYYGSNHVNLFISFSSAEGGVPVSMQEAASFGIPLLSSGVGGIPEIVNEETGILTTKDIDAQGVADLIREFKSNHKNTFQFRQGVRKYWEKNFRAENNFEKVFRKLKSSHEIN